MSLVRSGEAGDGPGRSSRLDAAIHAMGVVSHGATSVQEYERYLFGRGADPTLIRRFDASRYRCTLGFHAGEVPVDTSRLDRAVRTVARSLFAGVAADGDPTGPLREDLALQLLAACADQIVAEPSSAKVMARGRGMVALSTCSGTMPGTLAVLAGEAAGHVPQPHQLMGVDPLFLPAAVQAYLGNEVDRSLLSFCNTACSSSTEAIGRAAAAVTAGLVPWAVAGGFDLVNEVLHAGFDLSKVLSNTPARPFNSQRTGFQLGDGAGLCLIAAPESGDPGHRVRIAGAGVGLDGYHLTAPEPTGRGLNLALHQAVGSRISDVAGIVGHGTGTPHNDTAELAVYEGLLKEHEPPVPLTSLKSRIGHTLGAAGVHGVVAGVISLARHELPGIRNLTDPIACDHVALSFTGQELQGGPVLVSSSAFGGHNAALLLESDDDGD